MGSAWFDTVFLLVFFSPILIGISWSPLKDSVHYMLASLVPLITSIAVIGGIVTLSKLFPS